MPRHAAKGGLFSGLLHSNRRPTLADQKHSIGRLVLRKLCTALANPGVAWGVAKVRLSNELARRHLQAAGLPDLFAGRSKGALMPEWADLLYLYNTVRACKPTCLVEFGSGCSTVVFAKALADNARETGVHGKLYSMERDPSWLKVSRAAVPDALAQYVEFKLVSITPEELDQTTDAAHPLLPGVVPDFIYVDDAGGPSRPLPVANPPVLDRHTADDLVIVVDGRPGAVALLTDGLPARYRVCLNPTHGHTCFERVEGREPQAPVSIPVAVGGHMTITHTNP